MMRRPDMRAQPTGRRLRRLLALVLLPLVAVPVLAQSGGYEMALWAATSGLSTSRGGSHVLVGRTGQAAAEVSSGGAFLLTGGVRVRVPAPEHMLHLPMALR